MPDPSEGELIEGVKRGDQRAFVRLVRMHEVRLRACAGRLLGDRGDVEDALQETWVRAWRGLRGFDGRSALSTWLHRICTNVSLNAIRRRRSHDLAGGGVGAVSEAAADPTQGLTCPHRAVQRRQFHARFSAALEALSPSLQVTVTAVLLDGIPQKQAAFEFGCTEGTVAWRVHEARRRLRDALDGHLEDGGLDADGAALRVA